MTRMVAWCLLLASTLPGMAAEPAALRFSKEVDRSASQKESIFAVTFDGDVYAATRPEFVDLRIFDAREKEVPYVLEKATEPRMHTVRHGCGSTVVALHEHEDDLDVLIRLDANAPAADGLSIITPLTNFERRVHVYGSDDGANWKPLVDGRLVFDYSRYMDIANRDVGLPKNGYRHLKVGISGIADAKESPFLDLTRKYRGGSEVERTENIVLERRPFRMDRIELWRESTEKLSENERKIAYPIVRWEAKEDAENKQTVIEVVSRREPLTELSLETSNRNFSRLAVVHVPVTHGVRTDWVEIGRSTVSLVDFGGYRKERLGIHFPEHREATYRIVIHNEDSPPLAVTGIAALGNVYRAVFLAAENETYRLGYGSDEIQRPNYDAAVVLAPLRQGHAVLDAKLGRETANLAAGASSGSSLGALLNNPLLLGTIVVVLVALLGYALFHAARRINELPKE